MKVFILILFIITSYHSIADISVDDIINKIYLGDYRVPNKVSKVLKPIWDVSSKVQCTVMIDLLFDTNDLVFTWNDKQSYQDLIIKDSLFKLAISLGKIKLSTPLKRESILLKDSTTQGSVELIILTHHDQFKLDSIKITTHDPLDQSKHNTVECENLIN
jgi:hypothetical protein